MAQAAVAPRESLAARLGAFEYRNEAIALVAVVLAMQLMPRDTPLSMYALGTVTGAKLALNAAALVLVYRANRFVNFAQLPLAVFAGVVFDAIVRGQFFLNVTRAACGCVSREPAGFSVAANFVLAVVIALLVAPALSFAFYTTLLRRFERAPRLMPTLFTIFAAQALRGSQGKVQQWFIGDSDAARERARDISTAPPFDFEWNIGGLARLHLGEVLLVVLAVAALAGIVMYFKKSRTGVAIRASAESPARAQTLGVDVVNVTGRVWIATGLLAAAVGIVGAFGAQAGGAGGAGPILPVDELILVLAVAVVARFASLPMAGAAALVFGTLRTLVPYAFGSQAPLDAALVFLIGGALLLQRQRNGRAEREDESASEVTREVRPIPAELRHLPQVKSFTRYGLAAVAVVVLGLPWVLGGSTTTLLTIFFIYSIIGLSLLVLTGWAGQVSLGQFGFAAIGAWAAAVSGLPMPLALLAGGLAGAAMAVIVGVPGLKLRGLHLAISTLAFAVSAKALFIDDRYFGRMLPDGLERPSVLGMDFDDPRVFYYFIVLVVMASAAAVIGLRKSRTGRSLIAIRANAPTAQSFGINVLRVRLTAFAISGFLAAFAGALFAFHQRAVSAASFGADKSLDMFMFSVIGGLGGIAGSFFGFGFLALLTLFDSSPLIQYAGAGMGGMLLMLAAPGGLSQVFYDARDAALRRLAVRLRIPVPSLMGDRAASGALDRAQLDEHRGPAKSGLALPLRYKLPHQWALDRHGSSS